MGDQGKIIKTYLVMKASITWPIRVHHIDLELSNGIFLWLLKCRNDKMELSGAPLKVTIAGRDVIQELPMLGNLQPIQESRKSSCIVKVADAE